MARTDKEVFGWGWPVNANKYHFFYGWRSLCGKWGFNGQLDVDPSDDQKCRACLKKHAQHAKKVSK